MQVSLLNTPFSAWDDAQYGSALVWGAFHAHFLVLPALAHPLQLWKGLLMRCGGLSGASEQENLSRAGPGSALQTSSSLNLLDSSV